MRLVAGVIPALLRLREAGFEFVMVTNQDGLGTPSFPTEAFEGPQALLLQVLGSQGIVFREVLVDPHFPADNAPTRKPGIGMVMHYLRDRSIDLAGSIVVGDRETQVRGGSDWEFHFFPLFSYGESPDGHWWNVLYGLAGYERRGSMTKLKTLWVPIPLSD